MFQIHWFQRIHMFRMTLNRAGDDSVLNGSLQLSESLDEVLKPHFTANLLKTNQKDHIKGTSWQFRSPLSKFERTGNLHSTTSSD